MNYAGAIEDKRETRTNNHIDRTKAIFRDMNIIKSETEKNQKNSRDRETPKGANKHRDEAALQNRAENHRDRAAIDHETEERERERGKTYKMLQRWRDL